MNINNEPAPLKKKILHISNMAMIGKKLNLMSYCKWLSTTSRVTKPMGLLWDTFYSPMGFFCCTSVLFSNTQCNRNVNCRYEGHKFKSSESQGQSCKEGSPV